MPFDALPQREDPALVVVRVDMPLGRQAGLDVGWLGAGRQIPVDQRIVQTPADEAEALETLVRVPRRDGQVTGCHANRQHASRFRRRSRHTAHQGSRQSPSAKRGEDGMRHKASAAGIQAAQEECSAFTSIAARLFLEQASLLQCGNLLT